MKILSLRRPNVMADLGTAPAGSMLLALFSQCSIPLYFTPIPVTMQTFAIFLLGGILGPVRGSLSVIFYLIEGTLGMPVFSGGLAKPLWYMASTAGYLVSFVPATYLVGKLLDLRPNNNWLYILCTCLLAQILMYALGMGWLAMSVGVTNAYYMCVHPFRLGPIAVR